MVESVPLTPSIPLTATQASCKRICMAYGIWMEILPYFNVLQQSQLQILSQLFYNVAISRVQTNLKFEGLIIFKLDQNIYCSETDVLVFNRQLKTHKKLALFNRERSNHRFVQINASSIMPTVFNYSLSS